MSQPGNYQTAFPQGPIALAGGRVSVEWQRFFLNGWNRSGGAAGVDMTYQVTQINLALSIAQDAAKAAATAEADAQIGIQAAADAERDAQAGIKAAGAAQEAADAAQAAANKADQDAQAGISAASAAQTTANAAQTTANTAEQDAQSGISAAASAQQTANEALIRGNICINGQYAVAGNTQQYVVGLIMGNDGVPYLWYDGSSVKAVGLAANGTSPSFSAVTLSQLLQLTPVPSSQISGMANPKPGMVMMSSDNGSLYYRGQDSKWHQIATSGTL